MDALAVTSLFFDLARNNETTRRHRALRVVFFIKLYSCRSKPEHANFYAP